MTKPKDPRPARSYRAERRNAAREAGEVWLGVRVMRKDDGTPVLKRGRDRRFNKASRDYRHREDDGTGLLQAQKRRPEL